MQEITVTTTAHGDGWWAEVTIADRRDTATYRVGVDRNTYDRLTGGRYSPEKLVRASFEFLLQREPKESILRQFDLPVISRYFPEYERELPRHLEGTQ